MVKDLIVAVCEALDCSLGRSFQPGGIAFVDEREAQGEVDCLDWLQYFGPQVVSRIGLDRLQAAHFFSFERRPNGACIVALGNDPFEELLSIRKAASDLGLRLRPVYTKDGNGNRVEMGWP